MTCREVVKLLMDYLDGGLGPDERRRVEEHLAGCEACTAFLHQLRTSMQVVAGLGSAEVPSAIRADLLTAFRNWKV